MKTAEERLSKDKQHAQVESALNSGDEIDLLALDDAKPKKVKLPTGRSVEVRFFDAPHYKLYAEAQTETDQEKAEELGRKLLKYAIPSLSDGEIQTLSPFAVHFIGRCAARQADGMMALLRKNGDGPVPQPPALADESLPPRSTHSTKSQMSRSVSRKRSAVGKAATLSGP
jgi:hypothetical protein